MTTSKGIPLKGPRIAEIAEIKTAFEGDAFERRKFADFLEDITSRLNHGVILVNSSWGEGKSWFARHWCKHKQDNNAPIIYIDAFSHDYIDDPFLLITAEIIKVIKKDEALATRIVDLAAKVARVMIPLTSKLLINAIGRWGIGTSDFTDKAQAAIADISTESSNLAERIISEKLQSYDEETHTVDAFKDALKAFSKSQSTPVVIIIDELDRCRPSFAVKMIERIKHFFNIENLVFVLMTNRDQLEKSIKGVYGSELDATNYLMKFVDISISLPKRSDVASIPHDHIVHYALKMLDHFKLQNSQLPNALKLWGPLFNLTLRDIERIFTILLLNNEMDTLKDLKLWVAILKLKKPHFYEGIRRNDMKVHKEIFEFASGLRDKHPRLSKEQRNLITAIRNFHQWFGNGCPQISENNLVNFAGVIYDRPHGIEYNQFFACSVDAIDASSEFYL